MYGNCPDHQIHGDACKHCLVVRLRERDPAVVKALTQLVPAPGPSVGVA